MQVRPDPEVPLVRKVVVLGNGPSLREIKNFSEKFNGYLTIGCNHFFRNREGFVPDFYCVMDPKFFIREGFDLVHKLDTIWVLNTDIIDVMPDGMYESLVLKRKVKPVWLDYNKCFESVKYYHKEFTKIVNGGNVIISLSIPLAVHIGAQEIYLYGVDFNKHFNNHFYDTAETLKEEKKRWLYLKNKKIRIPHGSASLPKLPAPTGAAGNMVTILEGVSELPNHYLELHEVLRKRAFKNFEVTKRLCEVSNVKIFNSNLNSNIKSFEFKELNTP